MTETPDSDWQEHLLYLSELNELMDLVNFAINQAELSDFYLP